MRIYRRLLVFSFKEEEKVRNVERESKDEKRNVNQEKNRTLFSFQIKLNNPSGFFTTVPSNAIFSLFFPGT